MTTHRKFSHAEAQILRLPDVQRLIGYSSSQLYRMISSGSFPRQINLGPRSVGWLKSEVEQWIADRIAARDAK